MHGRKDFSSFIVLKTSSVFLCTWCTTTQNPMRKTQNEKLCFESVCVPCINRVSYLSGNMKNVCLLQLLLYYLIFKVSNWKTIGRVGLVQTMHLSSDECQCHTVIMGYSWQLGEEGNINKKYLSLVICFCKVQGKLKIRKMINGKNFKL